MNFIEAIILGLVQGFTEFIPVSSSGHLALTQRFFGENVDHLLIQALDFGTILALLIYFRPKLIQMFQDVFYQKNYRLLRNIILTCLPAGLLGFLFANAIEASAWITQPALVATFIILVGIIMIVLEKLPKLSPVKDGEALNKKRAFTIGVAQSAALFPGVSRSGSTIITSRLMGLKPAQAAEYSFLVSIPIMLGLVAKLTLSSDDRAYMAANWETLLVANIAAFVAGMIAVSFMLSYLKKHPLTIFGWYRVIVGSIALLLVALNVI
ncbi:MAG: undecaprenyl-diphosphate phosphatase [Candidatus Saccharimonadales bacterium]